MTADVAVIGGGPAGAAAALRLAQAGLSPLWVAGRPSGGMVLGEHLSAAARPLLTQLGCADLVQAAAHRPAHATYSAWGGSALVARESILHLEGAPVVLDRAALEAALSGRAVAAGARKLERDVLQVTVRAGAWHLDFGDGAERAAFVFDATGRRAIVAATAAPRFQADRLSCQCTCFACPDTASPRPVTIIEAEERGWWYLTVLADRRVVVNFYTDADLPGFATRRLATEAYETAAIGAFLGDHGYAPQGKPRRVTANSTWIAPAIGAGWVAIGDAAAAFDPLSSHGITTALWTALQAADAFIARDQSAMRAYADSVARGVQDYLTARSDIYAQERRWTSSPFWARRQTPTPASPDFMTTTANFQRSFP